MGHSLPRSRTVSSNTEAGDRPYVALYVNLNKNSVPMLH